MYDIISDEEADRSKLFLCQRISLTSSTRRSESRQEYSPVYVPHFFIDHMGKLNDRLSDEEEELGMLDESKLCHQHFSVVRCLCNFEGSGNGKASDCYIFSCIDGCTFFLRREINCFLDRSPLAGGTRLALVKMINYGPSVV